MKLNSRGFSMVEAMVAFGIVSIIGLAMATSMANMSRQTRALNEKLSQMEALRFLTTALAQPQICRAMLTSPSAFTFNSGALPASAPLPSGAIPLGAGSSAMQVGTAASATSASLVVSAIVIRNIMNAGAADLWTGDLEVEFDQARLVMALKPLSAKITFITDPASPAGAKRAVNCASSGFLAESLTPNGYVKFPNGFTMQWGRANASPNARTTITFPTPFTSQVFSVVVTGTSDTGANAKDNWPTLYRHPALTTINSFQVTSANDSVDPISWWAVGI